MPFLTNVPLPQCLQHSSATRRLLARDHDRGCTRYLLEVKCLFLRGNNNGYAIDDIPLVIFGGHDSIDEALRDNNAIPLTSQNGQNLSVKVISEDEGIAFDKAAGRWAGAPIAAARRAAREPTAIGKVTKFFDVATKIQETVTRASKKFTYVIVYGG